MTRRDDLHSLRQMLDHAREALALIGQRTQAEVEQDRASRSWRAKRTKGP